MTHDAPSPDAGGQSSLRPWWLAVLALALVCLTVGVVFLVTRRDRQVTASANGAVQTPAGLQEVHQYGADELSALAGYLPDLEEGRLQVAPPIDWYAASRDEDYVARFRFDRTLPLPRIAIEARDARFRNLRDVSRANLPEFLTRFTGSLDGDTRRAAEGRFQTLVLGDVPCIVYRTQRVFQVGHNNYNADREVLVTLRNGRLYTVTLDVFAGTLDDFRADAWAVMAGLRFPQPSPAGELRPAADKSNGVH